MRYFVEIAGRTFEVDLGPDGVTVDGAPVAADLGRVDGREVHHLLLDGASHRLVARRDGGGVWEIQTGGRRLRARAVDERTRAIEEMTGAGSGPRGPSPIRAPMPGLVVKVEVEEGQTVSPGQGVVIVEAMKMENELKADAHAVVAAVRVEPGDTVDKDDVLVELAALASDEGEDA